MESERLKVLALTNLFPSNADPGFAPFNRQQFAHLGALADVEVFGVLPWRFGRWSARAKSSEVVRHEVIDRLEVRHPRFPAIPGLPSLNATLLAAAVLPEMAKRILRRGRFDVLLAAYAYPDGVAGVALGRLLRVPVVVKCHGSDLNRVPNDLPARLQLEVWLKRADKVVTVSRKLSERARQFDVPGHKLHVVYNGVDRERFSIRDKLEARRRLKLPLERKIVLYVGHLAEHKGVKDLMVAVERLTRRQPEVLAVFAGDGPLAKALGDTVERGNGSVLVVGQVDHQEIGEWMSAADLLCLPSWDEGMPNVVREAHAAGRPVVATSVGGIPEAVHCQELGRLVPPHEPDALAAALSDQLAADEVAPERIAELGLVPTWAESAEALHNVLCEAKRCYR